VCATGIILFLRLFQLQVLAGEQNRRLADEQRIRLIQIPAARGLITDRYGQNLVLNQPIFRQITIDEQQGVKLNLIAREQALELESQGYGVNLLEGVGRKYLFGPTTAHLLGYPGEVTLEELADLRLGFQLGDMVGRGGIEGTFDQWLRGKNGAKLVEVDTAGRLVRQVGSRQPVPGRLIQLSIDINLQQAAYQALSQKNLTGAVIVTQAHNGQVLTLASSPGFKPEIFDPLQARDHGDQIINLFNDPQRPLINRALAAVYPPGSTFKIITAAAALESGVITSDYLYEDTGLIRVGDYQYTNWYLTQYGGKEGIIDIRRALSRSTDTFFYKVGELLGPEQLSNWALKFGLGEKTGIELISELPGLVPNPQWKLKTVGEPWYLGNTYHIAIGQGDLLTTPIQVNSLTSVIANYGRLCKPKLILSNVRFQSDSGQSMFEDVNCTDLDISSKTIQLITQGMVGACSPGGTAFPLFDFQPQVACKTGTAEFGPADEKGIRKTHAWLTGFVPAEDPQIVITVLIESGGEGSRDAAPIAREVLEKYFNAGF
jgi:penicillin-binding protein 2